MRKEIQFSMWIGGTVIWCVLAAFAPSPCANGQSLPDAKPSAPRYGPTRFNFDDRYGTLASGFDPSLRSYRYADLKVDSLPDGPSKVSSGTLDSAAIVQSSRQPPPDTNVKWRAAIQESLLYTGIMHTFNIWTEPGTRDTLNGHWLTHYLDSVSELRGWSDSDRFMAPYVGHTIEGSIFGYIERQNDPRYRKVQWGDGRQYYMSLLHSLAFSAIWHTQWKIGPASEASIGNVMLHASPGFITLADTPTLGTVEMIGEDAADRYLIMGLENRTYNGIYIALARTFLNPGRSFANVMAFKLPWHREDRIGVNADEYRIRRELLAEYKAGGEKPFEYVRLPQPDDDREYPKEADIELTIFPVYENLLGTGHSCVGGGGSGASRINPSFQLVAEVSGCLIMHMPSANQSADSLFYGGGVRWTPLAAHRVSPYAQIMFGGKKVTHETDDLALRSQLLDEWDDGKGPLHHYPKRSDWSVEVANNGPALGFGGGFDVIVARPFAWRLLNVEYTHAWIGDVAMIHPQDTLRITTGAVLRIGTW